MTEEERKHRQRMLDFAKEADFSKGPAKKSYLTGDPPYKRMTPEELAQAIIDLKRKYPESFPK